MSTKIIENKNKIICNPTKCSYSPFILNGPCRYCYGLLK